MFVAACYLLRKFSKLSRRRDEGETKDPIERGEIVKPVHTMERFPATSLNGLLQHSRGRCWEGNIKIPANTALCIIIKQLRLMPTSNSGTAKVLYGCNGCAEITRVDCRWCIQGIGNFNKATIATGNTTVFIFIIQQGGGL
jgi:hypothetical protein